MEECYFYCNFTKNNNFPWVFLPFLNCGNGNSTRKASHMYGLDTQLKHQLCFIVSEQSILRD